MAGIVGKGDARFIKMAEEKEGLEPQEEKRGKIKRLLQFLRQEVPGPATPLSEDGEPSVSPVAGQAGEEEDLSFLDGEEVEEEEEVVPAKPANPSIRKPNPHRPNAVMGVRAIGSLKR